MKKLWEVIKKVLIWIGTVFVVIFTVLFVKDSRVKRGNDTGRWGDDDDKEDSDEINKKAAAKREEAINRIERADARTIAENYDGICDAIADGKERFRRRVADCRGRD